MTANTVRNVNARADWKVARVNRKNGTVILHGTNDMTTTTNYHAADAVARRAIVGARLSYTASVNDKPMRVYRSH